MKKYAEYVFITYVFNRFFSWIAYLGQISELTYNSNMAGVRRELYRNPLTKKIMQV